MAESDAPVIRGYLRDWCIGGTNPKKVIHHSRCPHARMEYTWARQFDTLEDLAADLIATGAHRWHHCCQACAGDLADALRVALDGGGS